LDKPSSFQEQAEPPNSQLQRWRALSLRVNNDLASLLRLNQAFYAARGQQAIDERAKLAAAVEQFERERIPEIADSATEAEQARRQIVEYIRQLRRAVADLKAKEFEKTSGVESLESLRREYRLSAIEQEIATALVKPK
jgi:hypothetical protein